MRRKELSWVWLYRDLNGESAAWKPSPVHTPVDQSTFRFHYQSVVFHAFTISYVFQHYEDQYTKHFNVFHHYNILQYSLFTRS